MTQTAHVVDGTVREILVAPAGHELADLYPAAMLAACMDVPDGVLSGWTTPDGGKTWAAPPPVQDGGSGVRTVRGALLVKALDKATKVCPRDLAYVSALDAARKDMASIVRIAAVDGRDVDAWFDAALGVTT